MGRHKRKASEAQSDSASDSASDGDQAPPTLTQPTIPQTKRPRRTDQRRYVPPPKRQKQSILPRRGQDVKLKNGTYMRVLDVIQARNGDNFLSGIPLRPMDQCQELALMDRSNELVWEAGWTLERLWTWHKVERQSISVSQVAVIFRIIFTNQPKTMSTATVSNTVRNTKPCCVAGSAFSNPLKLTWSGGD